MAESAKVEIKLEATGAGKAEAELGRVGSAAKKAGEEATSGVSRIASSARQLDERLSTIAQIAFGGFIVTQAAHAASALIDIRLQAEKLQNTLNFANGGNTQAVAKDMEYLRSVSSRLGVEFTSAAQAYVKLAAASKGTALEGEKTKQIFEAISKASTVMGLSAEESSGALLAIGQMISKGTVQSEELRGQLSERLPGAFQLAARAMGVTTAELGKMLETGQVLAEDLLPKLADQINKELGSSADKAAQSLQSNINRMKNSWNEFQQYMSAAIVQATVKVTAVAADSLNGGNALAREAKRQGWGEFGQGVAAFSGSVASMFGVETDPLQRRQNTLSDLYRRQQELQDKLRLDAAGGIDQRGNGQLGGLAWREQQIEYLGDVTARINRIEAQIRSEFSQKRQQADINRENARLANVSDPNAYDFQQRAKDQLRREFDERGKDLQNNAEKLKQALELEKKALDAGAISLTEYTARKTRLEEKYKDSDAVNAAKKSAREAAEEQRKLDDLLAQGNGESANYAENLNRLVVALRGGKITTEQYASAASQLWKTQTDAGKAWSSSADAAERAAKAVRVWQAEHASQLASIEEETSAVGQSAAARKLAVAGLQIEADARKKIEQLSLDLSVADRAAAVASINAERDKQKALVDTALRRQQAVEGAYQLQQDNRRFAADSVLDERERAHALLEIDAEVWRERIKMAAEGSAERRSLEAQFQQWYVNQATRPTIDAARQAIQTIDQTIHDSAVRLMEQGKPGWKAAGDALGNAFRAAAFDEIYKLTLKPIVVNIVGAFTSGIASAVGAQAAANAGGGTGQAQQGLGVLSGLQTAWAGVNGGVGKAATSFAESGMGQALGLSTAGSVATTETAVGTLQVEVAGGLTAAGTTFAAAAGPVLGMLAAAYAVAEMNKAGWGEDNNAKGYAKMQFLQGGIGSAVVFDRLFGHSRTVSNDAQGIQGTFDLSGFEGQSYQERSQKGGAFRSDRRWTDYSAIGSDMDKALDSMLKQAVSGVQTIGKALNVETENALHGFSHTFALQLSENGDMSKAGEKIAAELKKVQDELATRLVPNIADFARYGESASDTFSRLNQEVAATDAILLAMGKNASEAFGAVGLASISARESLIDLAGGLDKLASKTQAYYQAYYSSNEQLQLAAKQAQQVLVTGFADIGKAVPANREAFRALVESQDLSTEAGRKLWNSLLDLADEFDTTQKLVDATAAATKAAAQAQGTLFDTWANDQQKLAAAQKLVTDTFAGLGKSVPATGADFLALAQSIDPATEAGQNMIAMLEKASNAFAYVQKSAATGAASMAQSAADAASTAANAWGSSADSIKSALDSLRIGQLAGLSPEAQYRAAKDRFSNLQQAAAGGDVDAASKLAQAATEFVQASRDYNGSSAAFAVDRAAAEAALANSLDYARSQLSVQQSIADASKAAVTQLQQLNGNFSALAQHYLDLAARKTIGTDLPSYDVGTAYVGSDQIAQIHRGEAVIDAQSMQVLRRYGIPAQPAVDNGMQQQLLDELRATRQVQQAGFAGMQQQLATANARLAAVEKRLDAVEQQARLSRAGA